MDGWSRIKPPNQGKTSLLLSALISSALFLTMRRLGYGPGPAMGWTSAVMVGGHYEFGLLRKSLLLNAGGCLIPMMLAIYEGSRVEKSNGFLLLGAIAIVAVTSWLISRVVPDRGVYVPWVLPGLMSATLGILLRPASPSSFSFVIAVVGSFVGADVLSLPVLLRAEGGQIALGGGGARDGVVWTSILAVLFAGKSASL